MAEYDMAVLGIHLSDSSVFIKKAVLLFVKHTIVLVCAELESET
jgi:hypothetical protein